MSGRKTRSPVRARAGARFPGAKKILLSESRIKTRVRALGRRIAADYRGSPPMVVGVLKGSVIFLADLLRAMGPVRSVEFMAVSSYAGTDSTGVVRLALDLRRNPAGRDVLLVEDIVDTGLTLRYLQDQLKARQVRSLKTCVLLDKPECRRVPVAVDYVGFTIPDAFVVGYGLDYRERFREWPCIAVLDPESAPRELSDTDSD